MMVGLWQGLMTPTRSVEINEGPLLAANRIVGTTGLHINLIGYSCCDGEYCDWHSGQLGLWESDEPGAKSTWLSSSIDGDSHGFFPQDIQLLRDELKVELEKRGLSSLYDPAIDKQESLYDWELLC